MGQTKGEGSRKGGRPRKLVKRNQLLAVMCNLKERGIIEGKARLAGLTISEYLRELGLNGQVEVRKTLPPGVLKFTATLNHIAANLNQIARKRNRDEQLNGLERLKLDVLAGETKDLARDIKMYLQ